MEVDYVDIRIEEDEYPYLFVDDFPVMLDGWSLRMDPVLGIEKQDGFRVVFGDEYACQSRCDGYFFKNIKDAIAAAKRNIEIYEEAGQPLSEVSKVMVKGFILS